MRWVNTICQMSGTKINTFLNWCRLKLSRAQLVCPKEKNATLSASMSSSPATAELVSTSEKSYFVEARSWADDMYTSVVVSKNRYQLAFFVSIGLAILLTITINELLPLQHMTPLLVNHYQDGRVSVQPLKQPAAPANQALVESEIVRYVVNRESYDPAAYDERYILINLMSNHDVSKQYVDAQSSENKHSPIHVLGARGYRKVHVDSVVFLDSDLKNKDEMPSKQTHRNLAQVNFITTDYFKNSAIQKYKSYTALVAWSHKGTPDNPNDLWRDWDGFIVNSYIKQQRNV